MKKWIRWIGVLVLDGFLFPAHGLAANLVIRSNGPTTELALLGQDSYHSTLVTVSNARLVEVPGSALLLALWDEGDGVGNLVPHYERAIELFPTFTAARAGLVFALAPSLESGNFEQAIPELTQAIDRRPRNSDLHFRLAMAYVRAERGSEAVTHFREALRIQPDRGDVLLGFGALLESRGEFKEAEEVLRKATATAEIAAEAHYDLGIVLSKQEKLAEAVDQYEKSIALQPANIDAIQELSGYYLDTKRFADAIRVLKIGAEKAPDNVTFLNMLAKLLAMCGDAKQRDGVAAVTLASKASQLTQDREPSVLSTLAAAYAESGDFPRAVEIARKAVQLAQDAQEGELALAILSQLDGYLKKQPYRDPRF